MSNIGTNRKKSHPPIVMKFAVLYTINEMTEFCDGLFAFICLAFATVSFLFAHFRYGLGPLHAPSPPRWRSLALLFPLLLNQEKLGRALLSNATSLAPHRQLWGRQSAFPLVLGHRHQLVHLSDQSHAGCEREGAGMGKRSCVIYPRPTHL